MKTPAPKRPSQRTVVLTLLRTAGYHDDKARFTQAYIESRVSREVAYQAWASGQAMRVSGVKCDCYECKKEKGA
jgi:hypothetical protein